MKTNAPYQWLLFDADGTLFDYNQAETNALTGAFADFDLPFDARAAALYRDINHQVWLDFEHGRISAEDLRVVRFERLFAALRLSDRIDSEQFSRRYLVHLSESSVLLDGAFETVTALRADYRLALITNGLSEVQRPRLARSPLADFFEVLAISEEMGIAKPAAGFFDMVIERTGFPPKERLLIIGDSLSSDILGGVNAGIDTCWVNPDGLPADPRIPATYEIRHLSELAGILSNGRERGA